MAPPGDTGVPEEGTEQKQCKDREQLYQQMRHFARRGSWSTAPLPQTGEHAAPMRRLLIAVGIIRIIRWSATGLPCRSKGRLAAAEDPGIVWRSVGGRPAARFSVEAVAGTAVLVLVIFALLGLDPVIPVGSFRPLLVIRYKLKLA